MSHAASSNAVASPTGGHTPASSVSGNIASDNSVVASSNGSVVSGSGSPSSTIGNGGYVYLVCSEAPASIATHQSGIAYNFRAHHRVKQALQMFAYVELVEVRAYVCQARVDGFGPPATGASAPTLSPARFRIGLAPRATPSSVTPTGGILTSVVSSIPHLRTFICAPMTGASAEFVWTQANLPPGMQLDFRASEIRFNYAEFFVGRLSPLAVAPSSGVGTSDLAIQLDFIVACSGTGFGEVYS